MNHNLFERLKPHICYLLCLVLLSGCDAFISSWVKSGFKSIDTSAPSETAQPPSVINYKTEKFNSNRNTFRIYTGMSSSGSIGNLTTAKSNLTEIDPAFLLGTNWGWRSQPAFASGNLWNSIKSHSSKSRYNSQFVQSQNKFYKIGGADESGSGTSDIFSYDFESATYAIEFLDQSGIADIDFPKPRVNHSIAVLNGNIYLFGGLDSDGLLRNDLWMFNTTTKRFSLIKGDNNSGVGVVGVDYPVARESVCLFGMGTNEIYLIGGRIEPAVTFANDVWSYNIASNQWILRKDLNNGGVGTASVNFPAGVTNKSCASNSSSIFTYGGYFGSSTDRFSSSSYGANYVFKFDIVTNSWNLEKASDNGGVGTIGIDFPSYSSDHQLVINDNLLYIYQSNSNSEVWTFDLNLKTFTKVIAANNNGVGTQGVEYPKRGQNIGGSAFWNNSIFIWNGGLTNSIEDTLWKFTPALQKFQFISSNDSSSLPLSSGDRIVSIKGDDVYFSAQDSSEQGRLMKYNLTTNQYQIVHRGGSTFEPGAPTINYPNFYGSAHCMVGNKVYYFGGYLTGSMPYPHYNQVWEYDIISNSYRLLFENNNGGVGTAGVDFPRGRATLQIACTNTTMYVVAGQSYASYNNDAWSFDLNSHVWTRLKGANNDGVGSVGVHYPNTLRRTNLIYFEGNLYLFGGQKGGSTYSNELWKFDLSNNSWVRLMAENNGGSGVSNVDYPVSAYNGNSLIGIAGNLYVTSPNQSGNSQKFKLWKFDLSTNVWSILRDSQNNGIGIRSIDFPLSSPSFYIDPATSKIFASTFSGQNSAIWELNFNGIETNKKRQLLIEVKLPIGAKNEAKVKMKYFGLGDNGGTLAYGAEVYLWQKSTGSFSLIHENNVSTLNSTPTTIDFSSYERDTNDKVYFLIQTKYGNGAVNKSALEFDPNSFEILYQD